MFVLKNDSQKLALYTRWGPICAVQWDNHVLTVFISSVLQPNASLAFFDSHLYSRPILSPKTISCCLSHSFCYFSLDPLSKQVFPILYVAKIELINKLITLFDTQSCPTLQDPMGCSQPGPSVHGILQARILGWVAFPFSRGSSQPRDQNWISHIVGGFFTIWAT